MNEHSDTLTDMHEAAHHAADHAVHHAADHAHHEPHELPNFISLLKENFPDDAVVAFLYQWQNIIFAVFAALLISLPFLIGASKKSIVPQGLQNFCEALVEGISGFVSGILGHHGPKHVPFLGTVFLYILFMNWSGVIPFMKSPTAAWSTTLAVGIATMVYVQLTGIREQGLVHYLKHIAGNPQNIFGIVLIPLMFVLNIILEFVAVPFSLSLRLFANVSSEDRLLLNFAGLGVNSPYHIGFVFQLFANILAIIFSIIQAFVFMLLSTVYISLVLPHEEHHEEHGDHEHVAPGPLNVSTNSKGVH